ncbi:MAG: DegV family protein [Oscillospiraceae bacterium]|nr:DegV family protein [Oscillospiraceae bacterium]
MDFILSCDSPADLTAEYYVRRKMHCLGYSYSLGGRDYIDDLGVTMPYAKLFADMAAGADAKTAPPNMEDFQAYFRPFLAQGRDVLHVCVSSGLTGVMTSANLAREALLEEFPGRRIYLVDSLGASRGLGLLMDRLADLRDEGEGIEAVYAWAEEHKLNVHHWLYSTDLTFYVRGGRITKSAGWFGTLLNICPLMTVDSTGHLVPRKKCRGKNAVMKELVKRMAENAEGGADYCGKVFMCNAACLPEATQVAAMVEAAFPRMDGPVRLESIGPVIGSHTGPGTVALFFFGKKRAD